MEASIREIWLDLYEELYGFTLKQVKNPEDAKDIVQEVCLKVQLNIHQLKHSSKLTAWIYQITRNTIIDHYRKMNKSLVSVDDLILGESEGHSFEYAQLSECINGKINQLTNEYKEAIILTYLKNFSQKELAQHLQLSYSGTKSRVQKARNLLKKDLLDCPNLETDATGKILDFNKKSE